MADGSEQVTAEQVRELEEENAELRSNLIAIEAMCHAVLLRWPPPCEEAGDAGG